MQKTKHNWFDLRALIASGLIGITLSGCGGQKADNAMAPRPENESCSVEIETSTQFDRVEASIDMAEEAVPDMAMAEAMIAEPVEASAAPAAEADPVATARSRSNPRMMPESSAMSMNETQHETAGEHLDHLPAGSHAGDAGHATVQVFYATDRLRSSVPLTAHQLTGPHRTLAKMLVVSAFVFGIAAGLFWLRSRNRTGVLSFTVSTCSATLAAITVSSGQANIEKHGVTYTGDRGTLVRGLCEVTVPDKHERGRVERPSLLRFEVREDQQKHVVLTSATELSADDFYHRLSGIVNESPDRDLLVFIHGYNVDFESAVLRTAQIAVDLPFRGVPVCYSWPSQGSLLSYVVDENNSAWTIAHLKQFLLELADKSDAQSINVIAHSMGNRALTAALAEISWQLPEGSPEPFDRLVMAAPDVDADRFRDDLAPRLSKVAKHLTLYASSDDQALIASKQVHGYPRAGESGSQIVVVPGIETIDVSGVDLSLLGHSYYGDSESMLRDLYHVVGQRLSAPDRNALIPRTYGQLVYWELAERQFSRGAILYPRR